MHKQLASAVVPFAFVLGVIAGCPGGAAEDGDDEAADESCQPGTEGCSCIEGNLCVAGLMCVDGSCVDSGATETGDGDGDTGDGDGDTGDGDGDTSDGDTGDGDGDTSDGDTGGECTQAGDIVCLDNVAAVCDGQGGYSSEEPCADVCVPGLGCAVCVPDSVECQGNQLLICEPDGSSWNETTCNTEQGLVCDADAASCVGECANLDGFSFLGCDFYAATVRSTVNDSFAIAIENPSLSPRTITVTRGDMLFTEVEAAYGVTKIVIPWIPALAQYSSYTSLVAEGSYRIQSTGPVGVTLYSANVLNVPTGEGTARLLPARVASDKYVVATRESWANRSYYAVLAHDQDVQVTLQPSGPGDQVEPGGGVVASGNGQIAMDPNDVLQVVSKQYIDLTGTIITGTAPFSLIAGQDELSIDPDNPDGSVRDALFPVERLGTDYIVSPIHGYDTTQAQVARVIAVEADTMVSFSPDQGANTVINIPGDFVEVPIDTIGFRVSANKPVMVVQYADGFGCMFPVLPIDLYASEHVFGLIDLYSVKVELTVVAPNAASVQLNGEFLSDWTPIGNTGYKFAIEQRAPFPGLHTLSSDMPIYAHVAAESGGGGGDGGTISCHNTAF